VILFRIYDYMSNIPVIKKVERKINEEKGVSDFTEKSRLAISDPDERYCRKNRQTDRQTNAKPKKRGPSRKKMQVVEKATFRDTLSVKTK